jgi:PKD domain/CHAP domain
VTRHFMKRLTAVCLPLALCLMAGPAALAASPPAASRADSIGAVEQVYASARHLPPGSVAGVRVGSWHAGSASGVTWAIADFTPSAAASTSVRAEFQDGASSAVFRRAAGGAWRLVQAGPYGCGRGLPAGLARSWGLADPTACQAPAASGRSAARQARARAGSAGTIGQSIAEIALGQVGVSDTPAATSFAGVDCDPYSTLVGAQSPNADGCGLDTSFQTENENETWCSDFAKWVWQQAGVTVDMNTLNAGSDSFYDWGLDQHEAMPADGGTPAVGDAVVLFPPGPITPTTYSDHVGIVTAVNSDGTINMANGDFLGASNISVQYDTDISLTSWASQVYGPGEQWLLVAPPAAAQQPAPAAAITGPHAAVAGTSISFHAFAAERGGSVTQYLWTFGDGRTTNVSGRAVSHVFAETGVYPVTMTATSSKGTVTTRTSDVDVTGPSSAVASVPVNAVWYSPTPIDQYLFLRSGDGLAAQTWDGASWLQLAVPGQPDPGSGLTALSYPDPGVNDSMTPHAYFSSGGTLAETYLGRSGWTTAKLAGAPAGGSAIAASAGPSGPEVFYFGSGGRLTESADVNGGWVAAAVGGPPAADLGSLALADTSTGPELFYLTGTGTLTAATEHDGSWRATPVRTGLGVAPDSPLSAITVGPGQVSVFFIDGHGKLAEAASGGPGWAVRELPGSPVRGSSVTATSYLLAGQSMAGGPAGTGAEVFYGAASGQPAVTYRDGPQWQTAVLPGRTAGILGADAYQVAGEPSRLFLSGPLTLDEASAPAGPWTSSALPASPATLADSVVLYAATSADYASALSAAAAAGLPASQVTRSFATAWADTLSGNYLVIAVGLAATDGLYFNACGWANPSGEIPGGTPFYITGAPRSRLPGPDAYEEAAAATASQTPQLAGDLAYYATHGMLPAGVTALPPAADPEYACSGEPS